MVRLTYSLIHWSRRHDIKRWEVLVFKRFRSRNSLLFICCALCLNRYIVILLAAGRACHMVLMRMSAGANGSDRLARSWTKIDAIDVGKTTSSRERAHWCSRDCNKHDNRALIQHKGKKARTTNGGKGTEMASCRAWKVDHSAQSKLETHTIENTLYVKLPTFEERAYKTRLPRGGHKYNG